MQYVMDMSMEREKSFDVFPKGLNEVEILTASVKKSKAGNDMLVATILCVRTGAINEFMFTMIKEKRWVLKSLLEATEQYYKDTSGNYVFDTDNLVGKRAIALVINVEEEHTDRNMQKQQQIRSQIRRFRRVEEAKTQPEEDVKIPF